MGANCCKADSAAARANARIDKQLWQEQQLAAKEVKILLLGPGESGECARWRRVCGRAAPFC